MAGERTFPEMGRGNKRLAMDGGEELGGNPFGSLDLGSLPSGPAVLTPRTSEAKKPEKRNRGRLDVKRVKSGRGGKTVTVVTGWKGIAAEEKVALAKAIQKRCGVGGAVKNGSIEIQGDKRDEVKAVLEGAGFRVVFAGG